MVAVALAIALAFAPKTKLPRVEFEPSTAQWSAAPGSSRVFGQAFLKTRGGDAKTCAGNEVYLIPDSPYGRYRMQLLYGNLERGIIGQNQSFAQMEPLDPAFGKYVRTAVCDASGRFGFSRLPAGRYYIVAAVLWEAATGWGGRAEVQGGRIMKSIELSDDDEQTAIVTW